MSSCPIKYVLAAIALFLLVIAPAALRVGDGHERWVSVRIGSRPAQDDPDHRLMLNAREQLGLSGGRLDPAILFFGIVGLLGLLAAGGMLPARSYLLSTSRSAPPPESGLLCGTWSCRAPPLG